MRTIYWTQHAKYKMRYYALSEQRVRRVLKTPSRIEEGIAEGTIALMQRAGSKKHPYEIWVMIQETWINADKYPRESVAHPRLSATRKYPRKSALNPRESAMTKIISAWRYPGITRPGDSLPKEILREFREAF